jgi:hypothetical protein
VREFHVHAIARLARFSVADRVNQDDAVAGDVERLTLTEKFAAETGVQEGAPAAARTVHDQYGVVDMSSRIARGCPQRGVMQAQFRQPLTRPEVEIAGNPVAFLGRELRLVSRLSPANGRQQKHDEWPDHKAELITGGPVRWLRQLSPLRRSSLVFGGP